MEFTQTMFEYDFDGVTPQQCLTLKAMTAEELYAAVIHSIDEVKTFPSGSPYRKKPYDTLLMYLGELLRRNLWKWDAAEDNANGMGSDDLLVRVFDLTIYENFSRWRNSDADLAIIKTQYKQELARMKLVKQTTMTLLKAPLLSKQINDLMDEILDKNGNKPSQFKDFLTPEHYRKVRMGCDISEWAIEEQEVLLVCLKKM
jgi:hypothetical protein